ncbi:putative nuclease HARBI1 [Aphis craccivora]|uniref:Putative nuclease HARBI1 n=1 Tax=Aphis craccivora TaxID=307492 RepID=A0A6G0YUL0_APHCR|nr:putative nuclease HARBI1 [Aphis craccivora]
MSDYDILSFICTAYADGELDGSTPHASKTTRKYWVHPLDQKINKLREFVQKMLLFNSKI